MGQDFLFRDHGGVLVRLLAILIGHAFSRALFAAQGSFAVFFWNLKATTEAHALFPLKYGLVNVLLVSDCVSALKL